MKINTTVKIWKLFKKSTLAIVTFWLIETFYFLIRDGWHLKATDNIEIFCDKIVGIVININSILFFVVVISVIDYLLSKQK